MQSGLATTPTTMVSDGTSLYWTDIETGNITSMSIHGGATKTIATKCGWKFIAVDNTYVYYLGANGLDATPTKGGTTIRVSDGIGSPSAAAVSGSTAYWAQLSGVGATRQLQLKSAPIPSGTSSLVTEVSSPTLMSPMQMAVTTGAIFYTTPRLYVIPIHVDAGPPIVVSVGCQYLLSDAESAYCVPRSGNATKIGSDGAATNLAAVVDAQGSAIDTSFLYVATNPGTSGTIVAIPKQGGSPIIVAMDSVQVAAVAVDDLAVYWATADGHIRKRPK